MDLKLQLSKILPHPAIQISGSKSETNRLLLLQALYPQLSIVNTSDSDDSLAMAAALLQNRGTINIGHTGTAMRFLTAYFAISEGSEVVLTGSERMQQRPIAILVDALRQLGADIEYEATEGFPPLRIRSKKLKGPAVSLAANVSSQYISALLLIGARLENGLELTLNGSITSRPYIEMTIALLREAGIPVTFKANTICVPDAAQNPAPRSIEVESDWSSASYFYSIVALSEIGTQITLSSYKSNSVQGDAALAQIYKDFGVSTHFEANTITLTKATAATNICCLNLNNTPDIAQTIAVTAFALGIETELTGLHTLRIKETDRLSALQTELVKLGAAVAVTADSIQIKASGKINPNIRIKTYDDHRMAMAFAPLALCVPIVIEDAGVVSKSYRAFWDDLNRIGITFSAV